jgi:hypothetical protein
MNIFYLSHDPRRCAELHCDKHVVKMILETAQLLSTAHHELGGTGPYKVTHRNHPSAVWVRSGIKQYQWTYSLLKALSEEYTKRYGKVHLTWQKCSEALSEPPEGIPSIEWSSPPQCMPDNCKHSAVVVAYQTYYAFKAKDWAERGMQMKWYGQERVA